MGVVNSDAFLKKRADEAAADSQEKSEKQEPQSKHDQQHR